jgi:hypothetical protein
VRMKLLFLSVISPAILLTAFVENALAQTQLTITTTTPLPFGVSNRYQVFAFAAAGGVAPYTWALSAGALPQGLNLSTTGVLSGIPTTTTPTMASFTIQVRDAAGQTATKSFTMAITLGFTFNPNIGNAFNPSVIYAGSGPITLSIPGSSLTGATVLWTHVTPTVSGSITIPARTDSTDTQININLDPALLVPGDVYVQARTANSVSSAVFLSIHPFIRSVTPVRFPMGVGVKFTLDGIFTNSRYTLRICNPRVTTAVLCVEQAPNNPPTATRLIFDTDAKFNTLGTGRLTVDVFTADFGGTFDGPPGGILSNSVDFNLLGQLPTIRFVPPTPSQVVPDRNTGMVPLQLQLQSTYTERIEVSLDKSFSSTANFQGTDPSLTIAPDSVQIDAGKTDATFMLSPGRVAGNITIPVKLRLLPEGIDVTPQPAPSQSVQIPRGPPVVTNVLIEPGTSSFNVCVIGFSTPREVIDATFEFEPAPGRKLGTTRVTPTPSSNQGCTYQNLAGLFTCWFQAPGRGGAFDYVQTFNLNGKLSDIGKIAVTLSNREQSASNRFETNITLGQCPATN